MEKILNILNRTELPEDFYPTSTSFTLKRLADFVDDNKPVCIKMTIQQEFWYRSLLGTEYIQPKHVSFMGIPINH